MLVVKLPDQERQLATVQASCICVWAYVQSITQSCMAASLVLCIQGQVQVQDQVQVSSLARQEVGTHEVAWSQMQALATVRQLCKMCEAAIGII